MSGDAGQRIERWLIGQGLEGASLAGLLDSFASQLVAEGVRLSRAFLALPTISPEFRAFSLTWSRDQEVLRRSVEHDGQSPDLTQSPIFYLIENGIERHRWRLGTEAGREGYALLDDLHRQGHTDYAVHIVRFGGSATTALEGVALSACTDAPDGWSAREIDLLTGLVPPLALAAYRIALSEIAHDVLGAYVGRNAASRILSGEIRRGQGHRLPAAILFADLSGFTAASESGGEGLIGRLGEHLVAIAEPIEAHGGEVLKFMGDGVLAGFPIVDAGGPSNACMAALAAAREAIGRNDAVNAGCPDLMPLELDVALHRGEVFYGNVGGGSRLDFTVIGPAVNEASRIEALCGRLGRHILMSEPFAQCCGEPVLSLGLHALRGVTEPRELFGLAAAT